MEKFLRPDGDSYSTEHELSPEERAANLKKVQLEDFYYAQLLKEGGVSPTTPEGKEEVERRVNEELKRQKEVAARKVIPFPVRDDHKEEERKAA